MSCPHASGLGARGLAIGLLIAVGSGRSARQGRDGVDEARRFQTTSAWVLSSNLALDPLDICPLPRPPHGHLCLP